MNDNVKRRILKVKNLLERSTTEGERLAAKNLYDALVEKYGEVDRLSDRKKDYEFRYRDNVSKVIILHVLSSLGHEVYIVRIGNKKQKCFSVNLTGIEYIEAESYINYYKKLWKKEVQLLLMAFVNKHDLFSPDVEEEDMSDLTVEELEELERCHQMMRVLSDNYLDKGNPKLSGQKLLNSENL